MGGQGRAVSLFRERAPPTEVLKAISGEEWLSEAGQAALFELLSTERKRQLLLPTGNYPLALLKAAIARVPKNEAVDERLAEAYLEYSSMAVGEEEGGRESLPSDWQYKVYTYWLRRSRDDGGDDDMTEREEKEVALAVSDNLFEGSTGCHSWDAAAYLAEWALTHPEKFEGKKCVELGCGTGLLGICLWRHTRLQALILTDGDEQTVGNAASNLRLNAIDVSTKMDNLYVEDSGKEPRTVACQLQCWEKEVMSGPLAAMKPDIVVASDVIYDPNAIPPLLGIIKRLLGNDGGIALIANALRNPATLEYFETCASDVEGFQVKEISTCFPAKRHFLYHRTLERATMRLHEIIVSPAKMT